MKTRLLIPLASAALAAFSYTANAARLNLDATFGGTGKVTTAIGNIEDQGFSVAIQSDEKIVIAEYSRNASNDALAVVRYNTDGSLDTTFNGTGKVTIAGGLLSGQGTGVVIQNDGKIVVSVISGNGSNNDFAVVRFNTDGSLDTNFGGDGIVTTDIGDDIAFSLALQGDGRILVAGGSNGGDFALVSYNADGSLDTSFNGNGKVITDIGGGADTGWKVAVQNDGKIVVAGVAYNASGNSDFALVRYNANGSLDTSFNGTGKVTADFGGGEDVGYGLGLQGDGKIVVSGSTGSGSNRDFAVTRYNTDGSLDTSFNGSGKVVTDIGGGDDWGLRMALQSDEKILMTGYSFNGSNRDFALVRYNTDGTLDTSFNGTGKLTTAIGSGDDAGHSIAVQSDGKIVVAAGAVIDGKLVFAVVRCEGDPDTDGDGILDRYETGTGVYVSPTDTGTSPTNPDSDGDGLTDGQEVNNYHTNPNVNDTDGDGFDDGFEVTTGFDPTSAVSTPDALSSIRTAAEYRFNAANGVSYRIEASTNFATWTTIETNVIGTGGVITRFYSVEGQPKRYFRSRRN